MSSISIPIVLIGIFVTWSRVAWIATLFVLIVWLGQRAYLANKKVFAIYLSVLVVLFISSFLWIYSSTNSIAQSLKERLFVQSGGLDISMLERKVLFERALTFFKESPFLGGGFGSFLVKLGENPIYLRSGIKLMQPVHNIFMLLLAEVGLIGSLLLAFPIGQLLYLLKPYMKRFAFVAIAFYVLIAGNFDHYLFTLPQGLGMLFIMLPLVVMKKDS